MFLLRLAFIVPAVADFVLAGLTLNRMIGVTDASVLPRAQFVAVASCWGLLLLLGLIRPVERAWVLLPTAIVIAGIALAFTFAFMTGTVGAGRLSSVLFLAASTIWLCWAGLNFAKGARQVQPSQS